MLTWVQASNPIDAIWTAQAATGRFFQIILLGYLRLAPDGDVFGPRFQVAGPDGFIAQAGSFEAAKALAEDRA